MGLVLEDFLAPQKIEDKEVPVPVVFADFPVANCVEVQGFNAFEVQEISNFESWRVATFWSQRLEQVLET